MFQDKLTREIAAAAAQIKTEPPKNEVNTKSVEGAVVSIMTNEELKGNQHKIDANKNGKVDAHDFKLLRAKKGMKEDTEQVKEGWKGAAAGGAIGAHVAGPIGAAVGGALGHATGEVLHSLKKRTGAAVSAFKQKPRQEQVEPVEEGFGDLVKGIKRVVAGKKSPSAVRDAHLAKATFSSDPKVKEREGRRYDKVDNFMMKKEETERMDEARVGGIQASDKPKVGGIQASDKPKVGGSAKPKPQTRDIFGHDSARQQSGYRGPGQSVLQTAADKAKKTVGGVGRMIKKVFSREEVEQMDEAFPTVADAKKRMAAKESGFEKKKISTGTVYSRKYKAEPEENDEAPKKKAKTMKEMLSIYSTGGAEALVENLMIEEPSQDEYKKEVEVAHAKAEGKIRNDKGIAKAAAQGVKMEEVEIEVLDADEINGVQIDNIEERSLTDAEMNKREEIVKSMKKGIQGFKDRYGDRAKDVMYATATKQAKKD